MDWKTFINEAKEKFGYNFGVIYRVYCQKSGVSYVGQTTDFSSLITGKKADKPTRIVSHYNALKKGCHPHRELQECFNRSPETFCDEPIEAVEVVKNNWNGKQKLSERERHWQSVYNATTSESGSQVHYKLTTETLHSLKVAGAINNQSLVFFILKLKNPWCDRPVKIDPLQIAVEWDIPESSVYEAILKLKEQGLLKITQSSMTLQWTDSQQNSHSEPSESNLKSQNQFRDIRSNSEDSESNLKSQNQFRDIRSNSEDSENQSAKSLPAKDSTEPQTIQTKQTYKDFLDSLSEDERESFENFCRSEVAGLPKPIASLKDYLAATDATGQPRYIEFHRRFSTTKAAALVRAAAAANALTEELYEQFDAQFRAIGCEYIDFVKEFTGAERELRIKFLEQWDRKNAVSVL